jgi:hypothetical protein
LSTSTPTRTQRCRRRVEHHELFVTLGRRHVPLVAQPEVNGQRPAERNRVLREERQCVLVMWLRRSPSVMLNALAVPRGTRPCWEIELAGALREVVVQEAAELAAAFAVWRPAIASACR